MSHKLEEYLKNKRESLDVESPDDTSVWNKIEKRLSGKEKAKPASTLKIRWIRIRNIAAAAIIIFCIGYITKDIINTIGAGQSVTLSSIDSNLGQREEQYRTMVNDRTHEVSMMGGTDDDVVRELLVELAGVDTIYRQSMADLRILGYNEKVINTIFDTYEQKIRLLELIILETNKTEIHENNEKMSL
ncbi:MAG: hypothetical protein V1903_13910 [Bacteroidota bacterium]